MRRWFELQSGISSTGLFLRHELRARNGGMADQLPDFVEQLVELIVGYAISDNPDLDAVFNTRYRIPDADSARLSRRSLLRLLNPCENYRVLKGFTGECLAHWIQESFDPPLAITPPRAHSLEPAFDLVTVTDASGELRTTCFQSKTTAGRASTEAGGAVRKYEKLHRGEYDFELASTLTMLASIPNLRERLVGLDWRNILLDADRRGYGIVIAYDGAPPDGSLSQWPSAWARVIPGIAERRILITLPLTDCNGLIAQLAEDIRARVA